MNKNENMKKDKFLFERSSVEESQNIQDGLKKYIDNEYEPAKRDSFAFSAKTQNSEFMGGVSGYIHWGWVYVAQLWVKEDYRRHGVGEYLMQSLESWTQNQNFKGIYVDTFSEKTSEFYQKLGFKKFGIIPNFPSTGNNRHYLYKDFQI